MGRRLACSAAVIASAVVFSFVARSQDTLETKFLAACAKMIMQENPIWTEPQLAQMCNCQYALLDAEYGADDIASLTAGMESDAYMQVPAPIMADSVEHSKTCLTELTTG